MSIYNSRALAWFVRIFYLSTAASNSGLLNFFSETEHVHTRATKIASFNARDERFQNIRYRHPLLISEEEEEELVQSVFFSIVRRASASGVRSRY